MQKLSKQQKEYIRNLLRKDVKRIYYGSMLMTIDEIKKIYRMGKVDEILKKIDQYIWEFCTRRIRILNKRINKG